VQPGNKRGDALLIVGDDPLLRARRAAISSVALHHAQSSTRPQQSLQIRVLLCPTTSALCDTPVGQGGAGQRGLPSAVYDRDRVATRDEALVRVTGVVERRGEALRVMLLTA